MALPRNAPERVGGRSCTALSKDLLVGIVDELAPLVASLERSLVTEGLTVVGSRASGHADAESDVDLFVFVLPDRDVDVLSAREDLAQELADPTRPCVIRQTGHPYADAWTLGDTGLQLDVMFWSTTWAEEELEWRLVRHQRQVGEASTAFWRSIRDGLPVFDRSGWVGRLQQRACTPFPDELRSEVLRYNMDLLGRRTRPRSSISWTRPSDAATTSPRTTRALDGSPATSTRSSQPTACSTPARSG